MICHPSNSISKSKLVSPRERNNELSHLLRPFPRAVCEHVPSKWKRSCLCGFGGAQEVPAGTGSEAPTPLGTPPCKTQGKVGSPPLLSLIPTSSASAGSVHSSFAPYLESTHPSLSTSSPDQTTIAKPHQDGGNGLITHPFILLSVFLQPSEPDHVTLVFKALQSPPTASVENANSFHEGSRPP